MSSTAVNDWLSVLEASNQVQLLEPYFENLGKRLVKRPKLYFSDTGLLCYLLGQDERSLPRSPYLGAIWETAVHAQLRKQRDREGGPTTLWFYRDAQQREVDFVIAHGNSLSLLEVQWTETPETRDARTVEAVARILRERGKRPEVQASIVCRTPHSTLVGDRTRVIDLRTLGGKPPASSAALPWLSSPPSSRAVPRRDGLRSKIEHRAQLRRKKLSVSETSRIQRTGGRCFVLR